MNDEFAQFQRQEKKPIPKPRPVVPPELIERIRANNIENERTPLIPAAFLQPSANLDKFITALNELPDRYSDKVQLMQLAQKLYHLLRISSVIADRNEVLHLTVEFVLAIVKAIGWTTAYDQFSNDSYGNAKTAAFFAGFLGILPQLISLVARKLSGVSTLELGRFLQRTITSTAVAVIPPLVFYHDRSANAENLADSVWNAVRAAILVAIAEKISGVVVYDATQTVRLSYIKLKEWFLARYSRRDQGLHMRETILELESRASDKPMAPKTRRIKRAIDRYDSLPQLHLFFFILCFVLMVRDESTNRRPQNAFHGNNYGLDIMSGLVSFIFAALLSKIHDISSILGDY